MDISLARYLDRLTRCCASVHRGQRIIAAGAARRVAAHSRGRPHAHVVLIVGGITGVVHFAGSDQPHAATREREQPFVAELERLPL